MEIYHGLDALVPVMTTYIKLVSNKAKLAVLVLQSGAVARARKISGGGDVHLLCKACRKHSLGDGVLAAKRRTATRTWGCTKSWVSTLVGLLSAKSSGPGLMLLIGSSPYLPPGTSDAFSVRN